MTQPPFETQPAAQVRKPGSILDAASGKPVSFEELIDTLARKQVIYVGERHNDPGHHEIQLRILSALHARQPRLGMGMEMFDHTYQPKLDRWSAGQYEWTEFLEQTHWYANWKFDDSLYRNLLMYVQTNHLRLIGLNIPFWLPPKISIGGLDSLTESERAMLPDRIDTSNSAHRDYVKEIYTAHHHFMKGRNDFESFYQAQCAWEDGMACAIAQNLGEGPILVLAGNGHIINKFGIPDRAYARTHAPFSTVYLAYPDEKFDERTADFIWITSKQEH